MSDAYDNLLTASLLFTEAHDGLTARPFIVLIDRHNDEKATFHPSCEVEEMERIVNMLNGEQRGGYAAVDQE